MSESNTSLSLEIDQDLPFQQRLWALQRLGWCVIACIIIAALLGLLGPGPLSSRSIESPKQTFRLEYERFLRHRTSTLLRVILPPHGQTRQEARVWYEKGLIKEMIVTHIVPLPLRTEVDGQGLAYVFRAVNQTEPFFVTFSLEPQSFGALSGRVGVAPNDALYIRQFVYP
jgi:hypothetical protein